MSVVVCLALVSCVEDNGKPAEMGWYDADMAAVGPELHGPSFMKSSRSDVYGMGCAYSPDHWLGDASGVLDAHFDRTGLQAEYGSVGAVKAALAAGGDEADLLAFRISLALNEAGVFGMYADLGGAWALSGAHAGTEAELLPARFALDVSAAGAVRTVADAFGSCPPDYYLAEDIDIDGDGVGFYEDCNDLNPNVGMEIFADGMSEPGHFTATPELGDNWTWDGDSVYANLGGQQAMLGDVPDLDDVVVYGWLGGLGTEISCGFDCAEACGAYEPDDCYTGWQAQALGILTQEITDTGTVTFTNSGDHDICLDSYMVFDAPSGGQGEVLGMQGGAWGGEYRVPAHGSVETFYGSWTTDNGSYSPFLDGDAFWCVERGTYMSVGAEYVGWGALAPEDIQEIIAGSSDLDADGVEDHVDYADGTGVQAQHNIWDYQNSHAAVMVGKLAQTDGSSILVDLHVENRGVLSTTATLVDTLPGTWELLGCTDDPDTVSTVDGQTVLTWDMTLGGCTDSCAIFDTVDVTCEIRSALPVDMDIVELPAASIAYNDGADDETSWSGPAVAFDYDQDGDGAVMCGRTDRWRAGVLARADFDVDQDEGYHGFRCALARNSEEDCFDPGWFLQIGAFLDAEEDDISSECEAGCPPNTTFDQLARVDHDGAYDLENGLNAQLAFYTVGDELVCEAYDATTLTLIAQARATSPMFETGGFGMSTLNMFGDYDTYRVCEAYAVP